MNHQVEAMNLAQVELLVAALSFDLTWTTYIHNTNIRTEERAKRSAQELVSAFGRLRDKNPEGSPDFKLFLQMAESVDSHVRMRLRADLQLPKELSRWAQTPEKAPYGSLQESSTKISVWLEALKNLLEPLLGFQLPSALRERWESLDFRSRQEFVEWSPHLPRRVPPEGLSHLMTEASSIESVVLVADIRRSQELMIHSLGDVYSRYIHDFFSRCRSAIDHAGGIFDKFTGDGFVAYFNPLVSRAVNHKPADYVADFLDCLLQINAFAAPLFNDWLSHVTRLPPGRIGLAIGADHGKISFGNRQGHLVAVGEGIVWASRLAACAAGNEILINNQLYQRLKPRDAGAYSKRVVTAKDGPMSAWLLTVRKKNLIRGRILSSFGCYETTPTHPHHYYDFARAICSWVERPEDFGRYDEQEAVAEMKRMRARGWLHFVRTIDPETNRYEPIPSPGDYELDGIVVTAEGIEAGKKILAQWQVNC